MIVFWLLNLIWTLLGSATGIDKENIKYLIVKFCIEYFSSFVATELIESGLSLTGAGREEGRIALMMSCCDLQPARVQPWVGFKIYI